MLALHNNNYTRILQEILYDYDVQLSNTAYNRINKHMQQIFIEPLVESLSKYSHNDICFENIEVAIGGLIIEYTLEMQKICITRCRESVQMLMMASMSSAPLRERVQSLISIDAVHGILEHTIGYSLKFDDDAKVYIGIAFETLAHIYIARMINVELELNNYGLIKKNDICEQ
jgi:hypothetical protein